MDKHAVKIKDLLDNERYRNADAFIDTAINILLTWESEHPEDSIKIMQSMMPFTPEQEKFMGGFLKPEQKEKHFGKGEQEEAEEELEKQKALSISDHDHKRLESNLDETLKFISQLRVTPPAMHNRLIPVFL